MTSINLTREEAAHRSGLITMGNYAVALNLTGSETHFKSQTVVTFEAVGAGETFLDLRAETVEKVTVNGEELSFEYSAEAGIPLQLQPGAYEVVVEATIPYSRTGEGLHRFVDPADDNVYLYTQFETADAKRVFACFDQPDLKATYDLEYTVPADWTVISNELQTRADGAEEDTAVWTSRIGYPLSTYLVALCAGPYYEVTDTWRGELIHHAETPADQPRELTVPLGLYCRQSLAEHLDAERLFTETKQGFDFYHANFGVAYPFGKYDQIFVPEFNAGAMENSGCVTIRDEYVFSSQATHYKYERRADTVLHELAHMWFGDLVTMRWWDDLWLNESFATWSAAISQAEATQYDTAWVTFANVEKAWAYQQDQLPTTHPISTDASDIETVEQNFDGITYAKGASVLKQLQAYVGREEFFAGVRRHFAAHAFGNATFDDLLGHLTEASGRDLSFWADEWLKTSGVNTLAAECELTDGAYTSFAVRQSGKTLRTHRIAVGLYSLQGDKVVRTQRVELDIAGERTEVPELVGADKADLVLVNDDDLTYCLQELDADSLAFAVANIDKIADPMARTLCWSTAWEMTRGGTMRARDFAALVARGAGAETELGVLERIVSQAATAVFNYADPEWAKEHGWALLNEAFVQGARLEDKERSLIFTQALAAQPLSEDSRALMQDIVDNSTDNDLRWKAVTALVAEGTLSGDAISAELARDSSALSQQYALKAQAAINSPSAKIAAWDEVAGQSLGNRALDSTLAGLRFAGYTEFLQEKNAEFYKRAESFWKADSNEVATATVEGLFPSWDITEDGLARADEFLAKELPGGLRRIIAEQRARTVRALHNRAVDARG
ncbi:aminopeptidase N [Corynebacterium incognita]|uniref:Aminopeptidase N n=1 Tax=Corynebacterium incognita TaxID=2754725 RepID=A0A7G7CR36_9CORY|nr:aminopeptidase N [Corynebacterium incognita]QNE90052.1 aminopeptidase N [Corynebacterium incognita]